MIISILLAKLSALVLRILKKGATTLPGKIALKIKKDILMPLSNGVKIICITGTNGKTTTCALIEHALKHEGVSYFINKSGANMISGITTAFILNSTLLGKCKKEYAILECDENSFPEISKYINAKIIAVTNIFRDQLDRYGEVEHTLKQIIDGINNMQGATVILNGDCPLTYSISSKCKNKILTFGINTMLKSSKISDNRYCPICKTELKYKSRIFAQLGDFYCPQCSYKRIKPNAEISEISNSFDKGSTFKLSINGKSDIYSTALSGIYNCYNFCTAALVLSELKIKAIKSLSEFSGAFGRMEQFKHGGHTILLLLVKNPVGLESCLKLLSDIDGKLSLAFALNDNSADGKDISWIWDCSFLSARNKAESVFTVGKRSLDMALRLKYDGYKNIKIINGEEYAALIDEIKNSKTDFVVFANYTAMMNMRRLFIRQFGGKEFWK